MVSSMGDCMDLKFKRAIWGYDPAQVVREIGLINQDFIDKKDDLQKKKTDAEIQIKNLQEELESTRRQLEEYRDRELSIIEILTRAQASAADIEQKAQQESSQIMDDARKKVEVQRKNLDILKHQYEDFQNDFSTILQRYNSSLVEITEVKETQSACNESLDSSNNSNSKSDDEELELMNLHRFMPSIVS